MPSPVSPGGGWRDSLRSCVHSLGEEGSGGAFQLKVPCRKNPGLIIGRLLRRGTRISVRSGAQLTPMTKSINFSGLPMAIDESINTVSSTMVRNERIGRLPSGLVLDDRKRLQTATESSSTSISPNVS